MSVAPLEAEAPEPRGSSRSCWMISRTELRIILRFPSFHWLIYIFPPVGFKGNLSLLVVCFSGGLKQIEAGKMGQHPLTFEPPNSNHQTRGN